MSVNRTSGTGKALYADMQNCNQELLQNDSALTAECELAIQATGLSVRARFAREEGGEKTVIFFLSESHLSLHYWVELRVCHIDIFLCGKHNPRPAFDHLQKVLGGETVSLVEMNRG